MAVAVGGLVAAALFVVVGGDEPRRPGPAADTEQTFLDRWESWRRAPASFAERVERRRGGQVVVEGGAAVVQRFPDSLVRTGGQVSARLDGRLIGCRLPDREVASCADTGGFDPVEELRLELDDIRSQISGADAAYRVSDLGGGCFRLRHLVDEVRPRFGDRTDYCFDAKTLVVVREERVENDLTIVTTRSDVGTEVEDAALALPSPVSR